MKVSIRIAYLLQNYQQSHKLKMFGGDLYAHPTALKNDLIFIPVSIIT